LNIKGVSLNRPFIWLRQGWDDLRHNPAASLAYGFIVSALGALLLTFWSHPYFIAADITGFLLVGPMFTAGLVQLSRCRERGAPVGFGDSLSALGDHRDALVRFALGLLVIGAVWFAASTIMMDMALGSAAPGVTETMWSGMLYHVSTAQSLSYVGVGGILAAIVFTRSVVAVPIIIDRDADAATAVRASYGATFADLPAMLVWAALIVALVAFGFITMLIGMIVVFPLLGHATWHAYRDLIG
jgi:uncharacterized membrane protein